jgi:hypothetical protein
MHLRPVVFVDLNASDAAFVVDRDGRTVLDGAADVVDVDIVP